MCLHNCSLFFNIYLDLVHAPRGAYIHPGNHPLRGWGAMQSARFYAQIITYLPYYFDSYQFHDKAQANFRAYRARPHQCHFTENPLLCATLREPFKLRDHFETKKKLTIDVGRQSL